MRIEVTKEDIEMGLRNDACRCPVSLALRRETDEHWYVGILSAHCPPLGNFDLTEEVCRFVDDFDSEKPVEPFSFEIDLPEPNVKETR